VRPATAADTPALAALHAEAFPPGEAWGEVALRQMLAMPGAYGWIADGQGFVLARAAAGEAEILTLAVAPSARRRGAATRLMEASVAAALASGAEAMFLEVAEDNLPARCLYAALGFEEAGRRRGYYGAGRDALVLRLQPLRSTSRP
jgi:ribosomal-protein-alanine N-acetyltransferase